MITANVKPLPVIQQADVIDLTKSRNLLKPASQRFLQHRQRSISTSALSPTPTSESKSSEHLDRLEPGSGIEDDPEAKIILFEASRSKILQFEDSTVDSENSGRLLGSGKFEIYQLHQKRVSYLQCGKSVVYPILSKLKILKISSNQFLLTLSNPERYWRIIIDTLDESLIARMEETLRGICSFRNLYIKPEPIIKTAIPQFERIATPPLLSIKSNLSSASINSEMACFQLESDSSTFVENDKSDKQQKRTDVLENEQTDVESLDLAFDEFTKTIEDSTLYVTSNSSLAKPTSSVQTVTSSSSSSILRGLENSNWMDLEDDNLSTSIGPHGVAATSTPNTQRYISLNLNPTIPKRAERKKHHYRVHNSQSSTASSVKAESVMASPTETRNFSDSSFFEIQKLQARLKNENPILDPNAFIDIRAVKAKNRLSSMDVYNILRDDCTKQLDADTSFTGFIKSFF